MGLNPRRTDLGPKSLKQWICIKWVEKLDWNELDQKIKYHEHENILIFLEKIVLGTIRGVEFLYISHKFDYRIGSWLLQCFSRGFFDPPFSLHLSFFILSFPFTFALHVLARWLVLILIPSASLCSNCKADNYCSDITCGQRVSYRAINMVVAAFFLDILGLLSVLCFCNAYPC